MEEGEERGVRVAAALPVGETEGESEAEEEGEEVPVPDGEMECEEDWEEEGEEEEQCELAADCEARLEGVGLAEGVTDAQPLGVKLELQDMLTEGELDADIEGREDVVGVWDAKPVLVCASVAEGESVLRAVDETEAQAEAVKDSEGLEDGLVDPVAERVALLERDAVDDEEAEGQVVPDKEGALLGECVPDTVEQAEGVAV